MKKKFSPQQKAAIVKTLWQGDKTIAQISSQYEIHPTQLRNWKLQAEAGLKELFADRRKKANQDKDKLIEELYKTIGKREMEVEWLKKKFNLEP
jgi:transposase-like protein